MEALRCEVVVVGGGVVGLATAAALGASRSPVVLLERRARWGEETSSHNSGVIHAGLYYPPGSLKALTCVEGRERLYARCRARDIPHRKTGKVIVATEADDRNSLEVILERAHAAGVRDLQDWSSADLRQREPALRGVAALYSPSSGIVDAAALVGSYAQEARDHGVDIVLRTRVAAVEPQGDHWRVHTINDRGEEFTVMTDWLVNAAGLAADRVAQMCAIDVDQAGWRQHLCKGHYFSVQRSAPRPRTQLVYPVPSGPGLGIHLTADLAGRWVAGPDAHYVDSVDYDVDPALRSAFAEAVSRYLPGTRPEHLAPDQAGVRPKLTRKPGEFRDFVLADGSALGARRTIHLVGIESPGLTAAGALAARVESMVNK